MKKRKRRLILAVSACALVAVTAVLACLIMRNGLNVGSRQATATWSSISNVRVDFGALVTNRDFNVGSASDPVKAEMSLKEMYFHDNDFVLPLAGRMSCSRGTFDCSLVIRAAVGFEPGKVYAGNLRLGEFSSHGHDLGVDEKFLAATLFRMVADKITIRHLGVDRAFKAIHSINNDFIEFEK